MGHKMAAKFLFILIVINLLSVVIGESLSIVVDTTYSMHDEVEMIKNNLRSVVDGVRLEPHVEEFILVPFNDPGVGVPVLTNSAEDFLGAINTLKTSGGTDCPENSLAGIRKGLEISKPFSNIFVFTDAFANDYNQISAVKGLCRTSRSKVFIFLSGYCMSKEGTVEIYKNITDHCSGAVFQFGLDNFRSAFQVMKEITKVEWNNVQNYATVNDGYEFQISLNEYTANTLVLATGKRPSISVQNCLECEDVMRDTKSFHILQVKPQIVTYTASLRCETCSSLVVYKRFDMKFKYGFSTRPVQNIKETSLKPLPDTTNYITIFLDPESSVSLNSMELQSDGSRSEPQLNEVYPGCYHTSSYIHGDKRYRIIIKGYDTSTSQQLTGSTNILHPQTAGFAPESMAPEVEIIKPTKTLLEFGKSLTLACRVKAYPKPNILWEDGHGRRLNSEDILLENPAVYVSYITTNVTANSTLFCKADNFDGKASQNISIFVNKTAILEIVNGPQDQSFEYGKEGKIICEVTSYPEATISWYHNETLLENSDNVKINPEEHAVIIKKMGLDDVGDYKCQASNNVETKSLTAAIEISGLEYPEMATKTSEVSIQIGEKATIKCSIAKGNPTPEVKWQYKSDKFGEFGDIPKEASFGISPNDDQPAKSAKLFDFFTTPTKTETTDKAGNKHLTIDTNKAGIYRCTGSNILGEDSKEIVVTVKVPPQIRNNNDETLTFEERDNVELPCEVESHPSANIRWEIFKDDVTVPLSERHHVDNSHTLRFNANKEDSGDYHCIAENDFGKADKKYTVIVLVEPYIEPPNAKEVTTRVGATVSLFCKIRSGNPVPYTRWEFSSPDSPPTVLSRGSSTNLLVLRHVTKSQEGSYRCVAQNVVGIDRIQMTLKVQ